MLPISRAPIRESGRETRETRERERERERTKETRHAEYSSDESRDLWVSKNSKRVIKKYCRCFLERFDMTRTYAAWWAMDYAADAYLVAHWPASGVSSRSGDVCV